MFTNRFRNMHTNHAMAPVRRMDGGLKKMRSFRMQIRLGEYGQCLGTT